MKPNFDKLFEHQKTPQCEEDCFQCEMQRRYLSHPKNIEDCDDDECFFCSIIHCPFYDELHFHHDGCPSCSTLAQFGATPHH